MHRNQGIILKTYAPKKCKISLLDKTLGRIEAISPRVPYCDTVIPGMVATYFLAKRHGHLYELTGIELYDIPLALARYDIYFFHHVLEICHYFLPLNLAVSTIYDLLLFLLEFHEKINSTWHKKIFLLRFFLYLGLYPEHKGTGEESWEHLIYEPIDIMLEKKTRISERTVEQWLLGCMQAHPQKIRLKTFINGI